MKTILKSYIWAFILGIGLLFAAGPINNALGMQPEGVQRLVGLIPFGIFISGYFAYNFNKKHD